MFVGPSRESVLLDSFPFGVGLQVSLGVGHGFVRVHDNEGIVGVVSVVLPEQQQVL